MNEDEQAYCADLIRTADGDLIRARALLREAELMIERGGHPAPPEPRFPLTEEASCSVLLSDGSRSGA